MSKNRDRLSILAAVLEATPSNGGVCKTRIMNAANLSFNLLEKYLGIALETELIASVDSIYQLTARGREFLIEYRRVQERYIQAQEQLESLSEERERLTRLCDRMGCDRSPGSIQKIG